MSAKLDGVRLELKEKILRILERMAKAGHPMKVFSAHRTVKEQRDLYAKGRYTKGPKVTNIDGIVTVSKHQEGKAVDCCFLGSEPFSEEHPWEMYGEAGEVEGLVWGGRWKGLVDRPHLELP